jgi:hypothetical protein
VVENFERLNFGKVSCPLRIKGLRLPQDITRTHGEKRLIGYADLSTYGRPYGKTIRGVFKSEALPRRRYFYPGLPQRPTGRGKRY